MITPEGGARLPLALCRFFLFYQKRDIYYSLASPGNANNKEQENMHRDEVYIPTTVETDLVEPHVSHASSEDERERNGGFTKSISFTNSLPKGVVVTDRDGLSFCVESNKTASKMGFFIIYVRYNIPRGVKLNVNGLLNVDDSELSPELIAIKTALASAQDGRRSSNQMLNSQFQIAFKVPSDLFRQNKGSIHLSQLGFTLSFEDEKRKIINPDSRWGRELNAQHISAIPGLNFRIEINDPDVVYGHRYINVMNRIFRIETTSDKTKRPGVYCYTSSPSETELNLPTFHEFDKVEESLSLFRTIEDAKSFGNVRAAREKEYEDLKHQQKLEQNQVTQETTMMKHFLENLQKLQDQRSKGDEYFQQIEKRAAEDRKLMLEEMQRFQKAMAEERELDRKREHELQQKRIQEEYERRAAERKDTTEMLKWATAMVAGFSTLAFTITKLTK